MAFGFPERVALHGPAASLGAPHDPRTLGRRVALLRPPIGQSRADENRNRGIRRGWELETSILQGHAEIPQHMDVLSNVEFTDIIPRV